MTKENTVTHDVLHDILLYDHMRGTFTWKNRPAKYCAEGKYGRDIIAKAWNTSNAGNECFVHGNGRGYLAGAIFGRTYTAHRIAWMMYYGEWPHMDIDHINRDGKDNRIVNLRLATPSQNQYNTAVKSGGTSRYKGVCWHKSNKKWIASIRIKGRRTHLGYFSDEEDAARAYDNTAKSAFGKFALVNF